MRDIKTSLAQDKEDFEKVWEEVKNDCKDMDSRFFTNVETIKDGSEKTDKRISNNDKSYKSALSDLKTDLENTISDQEKVIQNNISNMKEALAKTIEKSANDIERLDNALHEKQVSIERGVKENLKTYR